MARRGKRGARDTGTGPLGSVPPFDQQAVNELVGMLEGGQIVEAILVMEELRQSYPREAVLHKLLGMAYSEIGELSGAAERWEEANRLDPDDATLWRLLAGVYQGQGRPAHALRALRRYLALEPDDEDRAQLAELVAGLDRGLATLGEAFGATPADAERGALLLEQGLRAMEEGEYADALRRFRDAARLLPGWTAPRNNIALCQFQTGKGEEALATARAILEEQPDDVNALSGLVNFLTTLGRRDEALPHADRLWALTQAAQAAGDEQPFEFEKAANAFVVLEQDERTIAALEPRPHETLSDFGLIALGTALANVGRKPAALQVFEELAPDPFAARLAEALRLGETPPGGRFPIGARDDLIPAGILSAAIDELDRDRRARGVADTDKEENQASLRALAERLPAVKAAYMASLWLDDEVSSAQAAAMLIGMGLPETIEAVRAFAFGRLGPDDPRLYAARLLREGGLVDANKPLYLWLDGRYQELRLPRYTIAAGQPGADGAAPARPYPPAIGKQMSKALERRQRGDLDGAARLYLQVLAQDPTIADAEQHLGLIEVMQGNVEGAEAHLARALALHPDYVLPRCTLASLRISQGRTAEARDLLIPLTERTTFEASELASYLFTTAELAAADGDTARARAQLRLLLAYLPHHNPARLRLRDLERAEQEARQGAPAQGGSPLGQLLQGPGDVPGPGGNIAPLGPRR